MKKQDRDENFTKMDKWVYNMCIKSQYPLFQWIANSLKRDVEYSTPRKIRKGIRFFWGMLTAKFYLNKCTKVGKRARTYDRKPYIDNAGTMILGDDVIINSRNVRSDFVTRPNGILEIGNHNHINFGASFVAANHIKIGSDCHFGPYCFILDSNAHLTQGDRFENAPGEPIIIEDEVWLASHVIVLKGSLIGKGSTIAAGSVVSGYIPPYTVAGGVPARVIKYLTPPDGIKRVRINEKPKKEIPLYIKQLVNQVVMDTLKIKNIRVDPFNPAYRRDWNSFEHLQIIENLERRFNLEFSDKDIVRMASIQKMYEIIATKYREQKVDLTTDSIDDTPYLDFKSNVES